MWSIATNRATATTLPRDVGRTAGPANRPGQPFDTRCLGEDESACDAARTGTAVTQTSRAVITRLWRMGLLVPDVTVNTPPSLASEGSSGQAPRPTCRSPNRILKGAARRRSQPSRLLSEARPRSVADLRRTPPGQDHPRSVRRG